MDEKRKALTKTTYLLPSPQQYFVAFGLSMQFIIFHHFLLFFSFYKIDRFEGKENKNKCYT